MNVRTAPTLFQPNLLVSNAHLQTLLARYQPANLRAGLREFPLVLDAGPDQTGWATEQAVRLHGYYTPRLTASDTRGLVLLLHGWEGNSHSTYNQLSADALIRAGYDVFRLNLRDHGPGLQLDPYALNRGLFMASLFDEVFAATQQVAAMAGKAPFYIVGPSLGGNFALRLALRHRQEPLAQLARVIVFNPVLDPFISAQALDRNPFYLRYFRQRWLASLRAKARLFPELYDFSMLEAIPRLIPMTDALLERYGKQLGNFRDARAYFDSYRIDPADLAQLTVPTTIISSANDRVVPVSTIQAVAPHALLDVQIYPTGGHVGYVELFPLRHKLPQLLLHALRAEPS